MWAAMWVETLASRKPKTRESYESIVHRRLLPRFAASPIAAIDYPCVLAFVAGLHRAGLGAGTVRNVARGFVGSAFETSDASDAGVSGGLAVEINAALMHQPGHPVARCGHRTVRDSDGREINRQNADLGELPDVASVDAAPRLGQGDRRAVVGLVGGRALVSALVNRIRVDLGIARRWRGPLLRAIGVTVVVVILGRAIVLAVSVNADRFRTIRQHHTSGVPNPRSAASCPVGANARPAGSSNSTLAAPSPTWPLRSGARRGLCATRSVVTTSPRHATVGWRRCHAGPSAASGGTAHRRRHRREVRHHAVPSRVHLPRPSPTQANGPTTLRVRRVERAVVAAGGAGVGRHAARHRPTRRLRPDRGSRRASSSWHRGARRRVGPLGAHRGADRPERASCGGARRVEVEATAEVRRAMEVRVRAERERGVRRGRSAERRSSTRATTRRYGWLTVLAESRTFGDHGPVPPCTRRDCSVACWCRSKPLLSRAVFGARRSEPGGVGVALWWVREWLLRSAGVQGSAGRAGCDESLRCPPGPVVSAAPRSTWSCRYTASLMRRLRARIASFFLLPSASLRR